MMSKLERFNIPTAFHEIKDTPHLFWAVEPWFTETLDLTLQFLDQNLK